LVLERGGRLPMGAVQTSEARVRGRHIVSALCLLEERNRLFQLFNRRLVQRQLEQIVTPPVKNFAFELLVPNRVRLGLESVESVEGLSGDDADAERSEAH